jgi:hypothetical protein
MTFSIVLIIAIISLGWAEYNNESDKIKNTGTEPSANENNAGLTQDTQELVSRNPDIVALPEADQKEQKQPAAGKIIFSLKAGEDNSGLFIESPYIDVGADIHSANGELYATSRLSVPVIGPLWIMMGTEMDSYLPGTLYVSETGFRLKLGTATAGLRAYFAPSFKLAGASLSFVMRDVFCIIDEGVKNLYTQKKISIDEYSDRSFANSFGLSYLEINLGYQDPLLTDAFTFGLDKIKMEITTTWKIDLLLLSFRADFNFDFSEYTVFQGVGITTRDFNFMALFKTLSAARGVCIPPEITVAIDYMIPLETGNL